MLGIFSALGAASSWTYACHLWRKQTKYFSAAQINIIKNIIAFVIFSPVILTLNLQSNFKEVLILLLSGIIGISIGDTFYIIALKNLGTRRTLTVEAISPVIAMLIGSLFLNETLPFKAWLGVFMVSISLVGVALQKSIDDAHSTYKSYKNIGFIFAFLSVLCAVMAATLSRFVLTKYDLNPFQTTEIRLFGSIFGLMPLMQNNLIDSIKKLPIESKLGILYATFFGTNIGILLQQNVFRLLPIGLGWTLLSASPMISLFFARAEGEELKWNTLLLTMMAILGVGIVFI